MEYAIITAGATMIAALIGFIGRGLFRGKPKLFDNPSAEHSRTGDMANSYWLREFDRLHEAMEKGFAGVIKAIEDK